MWHVPSNDINGVEVTCIVLKITNIMQTESVRFSVSTNESHALAQLRVKRAQIVICIRVFSARCTATHNARE